MSNDMGTNRLAAKSVKEALSFKPSAEILGANESLNELRRMVLSAHFADEAAKIEKAILGRCAHVDLDSRTRVHLFGV